MYKLKGFAMRKIDWIGLISIIFLIGALLYQEGQHRAEKRMIYQNVQQSIDNLDDRVDKINYTIIMILSAK